MKNNILKYITLSLTCGLMLSSCTDGFEEINRDKKHGEQVDVKYLVPNVQLNFAESIVQSLSENYNISSLLAQHVSRLQYLEPTTWIFRPGLRISYFGDRNTQLAELQKIRLDIEKIDELEADVLSKNEKMLMVTTLSAYIWQNLTDAFGSTPYSEALNPLNIQPKYDTQEFIYLSEMEKLSVAIANSRKSEGDIFGSQDVIFGGDVSKWYKFANSLLLRMAMRISDIDKPNSIKYANIAIASGLIDSNDDNVLLNYRLEADKWNPVYNDFRETYSECASSTMINLLTVNSDPRREIFWSPNEAGDYVGNKLGVEGKANEYSFYNAVTMYDTGKDKLGKIDLPGIILDYASVEFFLSEAALKGTYNTTGDAKSHFLSGVRASLEFWGVENTLVDTYIDKVTVKFDAATSNDAKIKLIAEEKWVALMTQGDEAWAELRRLDAPSLEAPIGLLIKDYPARLQFSPNEYSYNKINVSSAAVEIGEDVVTTQLWWDVKVFDNEKK